MAGQDQETIKEFLVALGFKIDESSFKKFTGGVDGVTKDVFKLGLVIAGTLAATEIFVTKIAEGMDKLYFSSKRTGSTIQEMNSFQYAVKQLGGTAEDAMSAMEALASFRLKYGPAANGQLIGFGVKPEDVNDSKKSLDDLAHSWQNMVKAQGDAGKAFAFAQAQSIGIGENTFRAMINPQFFEEEKRRDEQNARIAVDQQAIADKNREFMQQLDDTANAWRLVALELENALLPLVKMVNRWSEKLAGGLPATIQAVEDTKVTKMTDEEYAAKKSDFWNFITSPSKWKELLPDISIRRTDEPAPTGNQSSLDFWMKKGYSREQAAGLVANELRESGGNPRASNITSTENSAGLFQWSLKRRRDILKNSGIDINTADREQQLEAASQELDRMGLSKILKGISNAADAAKFVSRNFEVPANGDMEANIRALTATRLLSGQSQEKLNGGTTNKDVTFNQTNNITVPTAPGSSGRETGNAISSSLYQNKGNFIRNLKGAV